MRATDFKGQALSLAVWFAITFTAAGIGAIASVDASQFYERLVQPSWAPPAGIFGPTWTLLYAVMAAAAWLVWRERDRQSTRLALSLFVAQLAVNALWSWLFFAWHRGALAFVDVVLLLALIAATGLAFWRVRPLAGLLLVPYFGWVAFATALTWTVWNANPHLL